MLLPLRLPLKVIGLILAFLVALPILFIGLNLFISNNTHTWLHLLDTVLLEYTLNSIWLCLGVGIGVASIGTGAAWLVVFYDFPGRRYLEYLLLLPLAMPAYVLAYAYTDLLQFVGPVQTALREYFSWQRADYWFPNIRSLGGAIILFTCVLYPYVYLLARTAFLERSNSMLEAAQILGMSPLKVLLKVSLPLARPAIVAGVALALMETLADYGTVAYFALPTFTTGIYRAWFSLGDRVAAAQLAACLLAFVLLLLAFEKFSRGQARYHNGTSRQQSVAIPLKGWSALLAFFACSVPIMIGFLLPVIVLFKLALSADSPILNARFFSLAKNSFSVALITAGLTTVIALLLAYSARDAQQSYQRLARFSARFSAWLAGLGYAVPGSVIAVGVLIPVTQLDHLLLYWFRYFFNINLGLILTGSIAALIYAYIARFLSIALQSVESGMSRITVSMDDAARSLGYTQSQTLRKIHFPLLHSSLIGAILLVFVDVMKELPATLVMRPFNFDTLATQTYTFAADERLAEASGFSLAIVLVGLLPIMILAKQITGSRQCTKPTP